MKKFLSLMLAVMMTAGVFAGCSGEETSSAASGTDSTASADSTAPSGTAFKIGGTGPLTGSAAIYGTAVQNGAQIAVDEINAMGGIQFELRYADDENDPEKAVNAYNSLKDWGMQLSMGSVTTVPGEATSVECYNDRIFTLTPSASGPSVIADKDNVFQMCFSDPNQGTAAAQYIADKGLGTKIAVIYKNDDSYSKGIFDKFKAEAETRGLEIVSESTFTTSSENDFTVQLGEAKNAGADLVFLPIYYTPASLILTQANNMDYHPAFFGVDGMDGILTVEGFDTSLAEGVMLLTPFNADAEDEMTQNFVTTYQEKYGSVPNQFAADAYDCIYAYKTALETAGCTPDMTAEELCEKMMETFPTITMDGLTGTGITWDSTGAVSKEPKGMVIQNGAYVGLD